MSDANLSRKCPKPRCRICNRPVDSAVSEPIDKNGTKGFRITYSCHGEVVNYEVMEAWFLKLLEEKKPFESDVFFEKPEPQLSAEQVTQDRLLIKLREHRLKVQQFVDKTIRRIAGELSGLIGDEIDVWCADQGVHLRTDFAMLKPHQDVRLLVMKKNRVIGNFILPFWPDDLEMKWIAQPGKL